MLIYSVLSATLDVYAGHALQKIEPLFLVLVCFSTAGCFFLGKELISNPSAIVRLFEARWDLFALNLTTAVTWITLFYALKYVEPAIVTDVSVGLGPLATILLGRLWLRDAVVLPVEWLCACGISLTMLALGWISIAHSGGFGSTSGHHVTMGLGAAFLSGVAGAGNLIFSKRLSDRGLSASSIMAGRFLLLILFAACFTQTDIRASITRPDVLGPAVLLSVICIIIPLYLLQIAIQRTEPISVSLIITTIPLITFALQLFDRRISPMLSSFLGTLFITILVAISVIARHRRPT